MRGRALGNNAFVDDVAVTSRGDLLYALHDAEGPIVTRLEDLRVERRGIKYYINVVVGLRKETTAGEIRQEASFSSKPSIFIEGTNLDGDLATAYQELFNKFEEYTSQHSGWILEEVRYIRLHSATYLPLGGSSYLPLP